MTKDKKAPLEAEPAAASTETPAGLSGRFVETRAELTCGGAQAANENVEPAAAPEAVEATEPTKEEAATTETKKAGVFDKSVHLFIPVETSAKQ